MTALVLARHGETVWHAENRYTGSSDAGLTERGLAQAADLGRWAGGAGLAAVWSSDLSRCRRTAEPAAAALGMPVRADARLRELDFGAAEGRTLAELKRDHPDAVAGFLADPAGNPMPGGEAPADAVLRARAGLADIAAEHPTGRVLVVAHSTLLRLVLCDVLGIPLRRYRELFPVVHNVALTELDWPAGGGAISLVRYNAPIGVA
jgi:broad specificity phosphatase PhoE